MNFPFQLIAFDLDDTLLLPSGELSPRTAKVLHMLHQRGVVVTLASGRMLANMLPFVEMLDFAPALVSFNGAQVNLRADEPPLFHCPVPAALAAQIIDYAQERHLHLHFYHENRLFATRTDDWQARTYHELTGAHLEHEPDFERFRGVPATKMLIADTEERVNELMADCQQRFGHELTITRSKPIFLEILHPAVNKGEGFKALCRQLQIPLERTAAFGDAYNDYEMLQATGHAVAMSNAFDEVKAVAKEICPSNAEEGVAQTVERWLQEN
jgi:Cof subfamily protein (haloacid dehalogenase superfamily)